MYTYDKSKPFNKCITAEIPQFKRDVIEAIEEANIIINDPSLKLYTHFDEILWEIAGEV